MDNTIIRAKNIVKTYTSGPEVLHILRGLDLSVTAGEFLAVTGVSGSGKSTLLHLLGLLDKWDSGSIYFDEQDPHRQRVLIAVSYVFRQALGRLLDLMGIETLGRM